MKKFSTKRLIGLVVVLLLGLLIGGCGGSESEQTTGGIQVRGSDTMVNLGQNLAEVYMEKNPEVSISVTGGGSGTGIAALINNQVDLVNSSRAMSESEIEQAQNNGVEAFELVVGMDGLAIFTNDNIEVEELTVQEIGAIFKGEITNWSELGGPEAEISLYGRQSNSGTYIYFRDNILQADFSDDVRRMNGTAQIVDGVKNDQHAIGYGGIGYTVDDGEVEEGLNIIKVAPEPGKEAATPLEPENVELGRYPIARPLYNYTNGQPEGELFEYLEFILSEDGQAAVVDAGFYPISPEYQEFNQKQLEKLK